MTVNKDESPKPNADKDAKSDPVSAAKPDPVSNAKPDSAPGAKTDPVPEAKSDPSPAAKSDSAPADKPQRKRSRGSLRSKVRWAKRIIILVLLILLVLLLLNWKYCHRGKGSGGLKAADGSKADSMSTQKTSAKAKAAKHLNAVCRLRVDKKGISHKGKPLKLPEAIKACGDAKRAELSVTGDATFGIVEKLEKALGAAGITAVRR